METKTSYVGFRTTNSLQASLHAAAEKEGRTVSNYMHMMLEDKFGTDPKRHHKENL